MKDTLIRYILFNVMLSLGMVLLCGTQTFAKLTEREISLLSNTEAVYIEEKDAGCSRNDNDTKTEMRFTEGNSKRCAAEITAGNEKENRINVSVTEAFVRKTSHLMENMSVENTQEETTKEDTTEKNMNEENMNTNSAEKETDIDSYSAAAAMAESNMKILLNREDYQCLLKIVEAEAGVCDEKGKILVANVVLNRMEDAAFPDTVKDVVYQSRQFSPVANGTIDQVEISRETERAVAKALTGEDYSQGALYFAARRLSDKDNMDWFDRNLCYLFEHDGHEFFKEKQ